MIDYLVGADVGTGGTKTVIINNYGDILGQHFMEYPIITNNLGYCEQNPEYYWNAFVDTINKILVESKVNPKNIKSVCISGMGPGCILIDKDLKALQACHIWMDRRAKKQSDWLKKNIGEERIFSVSGNIIDSYYGLTKLMWERDNRQELYKRTYKLQNPADFIRMKLTNKLITDYSNASILGIAFDIRNKKWDESLLKEIGIDISKIPQPFPCEEIIGNVTKSASLKTNIPEGTPVVAGTTDCNAAWVAVGAIEEGDISLTMGTSGVLGVVHKKDSFTKNMITIIHAADSKNNYTTLSASMCGGIYRYYRDNFILEEINSTKNFGINTYDLMDFEASKISPGSDGLITLPYLQGELTPNWDPNIRGLIFGLSLNHTRGHILRSIMEGAGYAFKNNFNTIKKSNIKINAPVFISEGGAKSRLWRQIICDMLALSSVYVLNSNGAPFGSAILAGVGNGIFKDFSIVKSWIRTIEKIEPIPANVQIYDQYLKIFINLYKSNKKNYTKLAQINRFNLKF